MKAAGTLKLEYAKWYERVKWANDRCSIMCTDLYQNIPEAVHENTTEM